jgi:competence protein ComEC
MATMTFQFLDVGQGDSTLVQICPDGSDYGDLALVDCGQLRTKKQVSYTDALTYLVHTIGDNSKAVHKPTPYVNTLFLTHADPDHYNLVGRLVTSHFRNYGAADRLKFGEVVFSGDPDDYKALPETADKPLIQWLEDEKLVATAPKKLPVQHHSEFLIDDTIEPSWQYLNKAVNVYLLCANFDGDKGKPSNPKSLVLLFELGNQKAILQGDAEKAVETHVIDTFRGHGPADFLSVDALKLGHHGSQNGTSTAWVKALEPHAIFASGDTNFGHPYCAPICRVVDRKCLVANGVKGGSYYCCGKSYQHYNNKTDRAICMNLWYIVKDVATEQMKEPVPAGTVKDYDDGMLFGVQWQLEFARKRMAVGPTPTSVPLVAPVNYPCPPASDVDEDLLVDAIPFA